MTPDENHSNFLTAFGCRTSAYYGARWQRNGFILHVRTDIGRQSTQKSGNFFDSSAIRLRDVYSRNNCHSFVRFQGQTLISVGGDVVFVSYFSNH